VTINHCSRHQSKGTPGIAAIAEQAEPFLTARAQKSGAHAGVGCATAPDMASLSTNLIFLPIFSRGGKMTRALALLAAAMAFLAGSGASFAQGVDMRDLMGGGPNFLGRGGSPIPRETVNNPTNYAPGTIFINTAERRLYLILANGQALRYGIGVGRDGFRWGGTHRISAKKEWPGWTPPAQMRARRRDLPSHMAGGIENPLGARALYLGSTLYRIHGSNEPETIGQAVSSGCFRMTNEDVTDLYSRVSVGTTVVVKN
jgi:lipoprotein-anchoring transpeptidase ErfK/SrfK